VLNEDTIYTILIVVSVILLAGAVGLALVEEGSYYGTLFAKIQMGP